MLKSKIKILLFTLLLTLQGLAIPTTEAATLNVKAYGTGTLAGYPSLLRSSMITPSQKVIFVVEKPDGSVVQIPAQADLEGVAKIDLFGNQTKKAGVYKVSLYYPGTKDTSPQNTFAVYADKVSATQSTIQAVEPMLQANGIENTFVTVTLYDSYRNPVKNHAVKLISSLSDVEAEGVNGGMTDKSGRAHFKVSSKYAGVTTFTAIDSTANTILKAREEVVFTPVTTSREIGGNYFTTGLSADILNDQGVLPGPIASFEITGLPNSIKINTDQTFTITAKDANGNVAKNYTGTVVFSTPNDKNATLPLNGEYTFKESDQGQFTFNLALRFSQMGDQVLTVTDKENWNIKGETNVTVTSGQVINQPSGTNLAITAPLDGGQFGTNTLTLSGKGNPSINLGIFVDDMKVADAETDTDGFFAHQLTNLSAGTHSFYVMSDQGQVSETVTVEIDTMPPVINTLNISPEGTTTPGKMLNISLNSEPKLAKVQVRVQGVVKDLLPVQGQPGNYAGNLAAPARVGSFPVDVILVDELSNRSELLNQKTIVVQNTAQTYPPQVQKVEALAGNGEVTLSWAPVENHSTSIVTYHIYYGTQMNQLNQELQTQTNQALYKISGLQNEQQYFFVVTAVDSKGLESAENSQVIAITPQAPNSTSPSSTNNEPIDVLDFDLFGSAPEINSVQTPVQISESTLTQPLTGVPSDTAMNLSWQPFAGITAAGYKVYFGLNSGEYDDYVLVPGTRTSVTIRDLINEIPYYFAVVALDSNGKEISSLSPEFQGVPTGRAFHSAASDQITPSQPSYVSPLANFQLSKVPANGQVGMASTILVALSILIGGGFYAVRKLLLKVKG